jgi:hypothetical protein
MDPEKGGDEKGASGMKELRCITPITVLGVDGFKNSQDGNPGGFFFQKIKRDMRGMTLSGQECAGCR